MEIGVLSTVRYLLRAAEGDVTMPFLLLLHVLSCKQVIDLNLRKTQEFDGHKESCSNGMRHAGTIICFVWVYVIKHNVHDVRQNAAVLVALNCFCLLTVNTLLCQVGDMRFWYS